MDSYHMTRAVTEKKPVFLTQEQRLLFNDICVIEDSFCRAVRASNVRANFCAKRMIPFIELATTLPHSSLEYQFFKLL